MENKGKRFGSVLLTGVLCFTVLSACSSKESSASTGTPASSKASSSSEAPALSGTSSAKAPDAGQEMPGGTTDTPLTDATGDVGVFTTQDVNGQTYTQDIFKEYDLTMVNVFATWCSPCVAEMPDLEKLYQMMKDQGVNVVGVVLDVLDTNAEIVQEDLERAQLLVEQTGVTYPVLLPDSTYMNGHLLGVEGLPLTFFVDSNGNVVGEDYYGSGDLESWVEVVEKELSDLKGGR